MVRRSALVYDLLRNEQPGDGFSEKEIMEQISNKYEIAAGKGLRRQIAVALRRGMDFGIVTKTGKKYRFDPDSMQSTLARTTARKGRRKTKKKVKKAAKVKRRKAASRARTRGRPSHPVPRPRVPKAPSWQPRRRRLNEEPLPKIIRH